MASIEEIKLLLDANNATNNAVLKAEIRKGIKDELQVFKEEIKSMVSTSLTETQNQIDTLQSKLYEKDAEIIHLRNELCKTNGLTLQLQFESKKRNIILFKVPEMDESGIDFIKNLVKLIKTVDSSFTELDIDNAYRLGVKSNVTRPIKIELNHASKRNFLLSNKKKFNEQNISIAEDLPKQVSDQRKGWYKIAETLRIQGKRVIFKKDKFIVDGVQWNEEQIESEKSLLAKRGRSNSQEEDPENLRRRKLNPSTPANRVGRNQTVTLETFYSPVTKLASSSFIERK